MLMITNEERNAATVGYCCRYCRRSLYIPAYRTEHVKCACLRCLSVMYCGRACRDADYLEHHISCFLHPGWECKESTKRRMEKMRLERVEVPESPEFERIPEIENEMNPKGEVEMEQPWEELDIVEASPERAPTERA